MTDKQFQILRRTVIGAALFIGGALLYQFAYGWSIFFIFAGVAFMFAEQILRFIKWLKAEDNNNEAN